MTYKDKTWCVEYSKDCKHTSTCHRVLTEKDRKAIEEGQWCVGVFTEKPNCWEE